MKTKKISILILKRIVCLQLIIILNEIKFKSMNYFYQIKLHLLIFHFLKLIKKSS